MSSLLSSLIGALRARIAPQLAAPWPASFDTRALDIDAPGMWVAPMIEALVGAYGEVVTRDEDPRLLEVAPEGLAHPARIGVSTEPSPTGAVVRLWQRDFDPATLDALQAQLRARFPRVEARPARPLLVEQPTLPSILGSAAHTSFALRNRRRPCLRGAAP
jgi:hypothetical protein